MLYVGTSGWAYREWKPAFYPADLPQARFLDHYASRLTACEINATFYRLQSRATIDRWRVATPESFRFAVKAHRRLTHSRDIAPDAQRRAFIDAFFGSISPLAPRLGPILFQFPPHRARDDDALAALFDALPVAHSYAFEFRHDSWSASQVVELLTGRGATLCVSETEGKTPDALPGGGIAYVRLRAERYDDDARDQWLELLRATGKERDVYAFAKHEGIPAGDPNGGVGLAQWLMEQTAR